MVTDSATRVQLRAREILMPHNKTGCLSESIVKRPEIINGEFCVRIVSDTSPCSANHESYSLMVHEGTRPHDIVAKNSPVLAFEWHGQMAFFARVHHPGTAPIPFLRDALPAAI